MSQTISPNTTLAHYTIISKIGEGGMGEVYRARDTRLNREVAIKLLPAEVSSRPDRLQRFEQEARATSALNHPNILTVYDIGTDNGSPYIVAELLEGEELRDRLDVGPLPLRKAIDYAQQIVNGLSAAHGKGIVHRDLKPENLFITNDDRVKILDFGLAKLSEAGTATGSEDATRKVLTNPGVVMGTVGYMSPEQVRGERADYRSDIFAFGAILHEMISGRRAFSRETMAETMTAILKEDPEELSASNPNINPALQRIVNRCLEKKPERRFHSAYDLGFALESLSAPTTSSGSNLTATSVESVSTISASTARSLIPWIAVAVLALALVAIVVIYLLRRGPSTEGNAVRLAFVPPAELSFNDTSPDFAVISPDGKKVAFTASASNGKWMLYVRDLDSSEAKLLPGSDYAIEPFWSPDSRSIAFGSNGKLKRSDLSGGNAQILCDAARLVGGTWNKDGVIVFTPDYRTSLVQVSAQGGEPQLLPMQVNYTGDERHRFPYFLPDGRHFLFMREVGDQLNPTTRGISAGSLDSPEIKQISSDDSSFVYAPQGYLIFVRNDVLVAQAFDVSKLALNGDPNPLIAGQQNTRGNRRFSVSDNGILISQGQWQRAYQLVWFDREGKQIGAIDTPAKIAVGQDPHLSPDGKRLVIKRDSNLWVIDLEKGTALRITSTFSQIPAWSPDGSRIVYSGGNGGMSLKAANGLGAEELLLRGANFPAVWSPDGRFIIYVHRGVKTRRDLWVYPTFGDKKEYALLDSIFDDQQPALSANGKWLAYNSDETGNPEIYVQSFSSEGKLGSDKKLISSSGGMFPVWRADGSELFFVAPDGQMMSVAVKTNGNEFEFATPKALFKTRIMAYTGFHEFDVTPDGQRFLIGTLIGEAKAAPPTVIMNWPALLKK
ncbi:MAG TPA: protein kinase [Pyrinomonadaceae bacterium]